MSKYAGVHEVLSLVRDVVEFGDAPIKSIDQKGIFGNTPLAVVISWGDADAVRLLLDAGADPSMKVENGDTPLHRAALFDDVVIAALLLERNASLDEKNNEGQTPLDIAKISKDAELITLLSTSRPER